MSKVPLLLLLTAITIRADEKLPMLKAGAETYTNVTVTQVTATDIYFTHARGIGNAKLKDLEADLQKKFHFDPEKADEKRQEQLKANALYRQSLVDTNSPAALGAAATDSAATASDEIPPHEISAQSFLGRAAPKLVVEKWLTDPPNTAGKFVLLDFWATWCAPCRRSIPELNTFQEKFKDRLVVIGLSDEPEQTVRKMTSPKIDYSIAIDTKGTLFRNVGVTGIPHTMLIDPKGIVRFEGHPAYLDEPKLARLLAQTAE